MVFKIFCQSMDTRLKLNTDLLSNLKNKTNQKNPLRGIFCMDRELKAVAFSRVTAGNAL